jgi:peptidoglycan/LPS O-acetylase OafA/YrhL
MKPLKYRSDIDGLRAVAVLGVVIYHAFPKLIPGGFIGVDIFFVISGYLISGILYKGHNAGNFSFGEFYARRIRRLFPALITMLVLTMAYGWLIFLPDEFEQLGKHVAAGTLFIQNIVFWQESGYFDTAASLKPLLHLWSLAVEEQFYIFFPPILLLVWKRKWPLAAMMGILLVVSLAGNLWASTHAGSADFFLTPYRAWEFLGGSLLAWWHYDKGHEEEVPPYRDVLSWSGLVLLGFGMAYIHTGDPYPGWRALLPVAGTLLLMEGGRSAWVNRKILSNPAVVWIGLISYPLYLFHWPALSFVHIVKGESPKPVYLFDALVVGLAIATVTYYFIEKKIRHNTSRWTLPSLIVAFLLMGVLGLMAWREGFPSRYGTPQMKKINSAIQERNMLSGWEQVKLKNGFCINRIGGNGPQTVFFGDSNMQQYSPRLRELLKSNHLDERGVISIGEGGIVPIRNVTLNDSPECGKMFEALDQQMASNPKIDRVVIAARWSFYFKRDSNWKIDGADPIGNNPGKQKAMEQIDKTFQRLRDLGKKVIFVSTIPTGEALDPKSNYSRGFFGISLRNRGVLTKEAFLQENGAVLNEIISIARKTGAEVIDPMDYLCTNGVCIAEDEQGAPTHYDDAHLRPEYVRDHVKYLDATVAP